MKRRDVIITFGRAAALPLLWPLAAQSQQSTRTYRLAYLALLPGENLTYAKSFLQRLDELGYRDGQNIVWDYRSADGHAERLPQLAVDIVGTRPDVLITGFGTLAPKAAIAATRTIPIVFTAVGDPVGAGLVKSLQQPGGNATGMSALATDIAAKRLQLLSDLVPGKRPVAVIGNPDTPYTALALDQVRKAAAVMGLELKVFEARTVDEVPKAIAQVVEAKVAGLLMLEDPVLLAVIGQTTELVAKARNSSNLRSERIRRGWRLDRVWAGPDSDEPQGRGLCRQDTQGRLAGRPSSRAADEVSACHQPECRKRVGAHHSRNIARQCRRGDRVRRVRRAL